MKIPEASLPILPDAALHQNIAVLGKNGSGKTTAAKAAIAEPLLAAGAHVAIVDPTGAWWGLRSSRDGKGPGFEVLVLGGDRGDLPLPANGGAAVARLVTEQRVNLVADTTQLTVGERTRWFTDFAGALYRLNRAPLHLILDEAHNFAPQGRVPDPKAGMMLHAASTLASQGRSRGIRLTMITQRPQKLHKDSLTTAETLIAMRVIAPQDRGAVKDWIDGCAGDEGVDVVGTLANLARGEGWIWYPEGGVLRRLKFPLPATFDSSATPMGAPIEAPKGAAQLDLSEIRKALAEAVREAEANDPELLREQIAELQAEVRKARAGQAPAEAVIDEEALQEAEVRGDVRGYARGLRALSAPLDRLATLAGAIAETVEGARADIARLTDSRVSYTSNDTERPVPPVARASIPRPQIREEKRKSDDAGLKAMPRAMLTALAQHPLGLTKKRILLHAEYRSSGDTSTCFADLVRSGLARSEGGQLVITPLGLKALGPFEPLPTGAALRRRLVEGDRLPKMERAFLAVLFADYPKPVRKGDILERSGYRSSGDTSTAFARLVAMGYATAQGVGQLRASPELFE